MKFTFYTDGSGAYLVCVSDDVEAYKVDASRRSKVGDLLDYVPENVREYLVDHSEQTVATILVRCPGCGSTDVIPPRLPVSNVWDCGACGHTFEG